VHARAIAAERTRLRSHAVKVWEIKILSAKGRRAAQAERQQTFLNSCVDAGSRGRKEWGTHGMVEWLKRTGRSACATKPLHILPVEDAWQPGHIEDDRPDVLKIQG